MWQLIQTQPKSSRRAIRIARPWSRVHTEEARPYSTPFAQRTASSSSTKRCTVITGPKISSWIASSSWVRPETTGASWKKPAPPTADPPASTVAAGFQSKALFEAGLYCRADDRGDPVIQLAPPLICGQEHFDEIEQILRSVLTEAWARL